MVTMMALISFYVKTLDHRIPYSNKNIIESFKSDLATQISAHRIVAPLIIMATPLIK
jgi:hypothetical protein